MTAAAAMTLPGSRALPGWWREISELSPRRFWFAHLVLHRVEALVEVRSATPLSALARGMLAALARQSGSSGIASIASALALDVDLTTALVGMLVREGLLEPSPNGHAGPVTVAGHAALAGADGPVRQERRTFCFADTRPPVYVALPPASSSPLPPPTGWRFDLSSLEACLSRPDDWKRAHGFPSDVVRLVWPRSALDERTWQSVPLDRPEQALLLLVETTQDELLGLSIRPENWTLARPVAFRLPFDRELVTALTGEARPEDWRAAWQAWCQQRSFPPGDVEACKLEPTGHRLVVRPPPRLLERLRQARSEVLRGETWLMVGTGRARAAALVEVVG